MPPHGSSSIKPARRSVAASSVGKAGDVRRECEIKGEKDQIVGTSRSSEQIDAFVWTAVAILRCSSLHLRRTVQRRDHLADRTARAYRYRDPQPIRAYACGSETGSAP